MVCFDIKTTTSCFHGNENLGTQFNDYYDGYSV